MQALDVANFFIYLANHNPNDEDGMTNLRVNKLVYFAQAWSLASRNKPFFTEEIEAWEHGPVIPSVYHAFKKYFDHKIRDVAGEFSPDVFTPDEQLLLLDIVRNYDQYSAWKLRNITHAKGGPWDSVYKEGIRYIPITQESMKKYYSGKKLPSFQPRCNPDTDVIRERSANNILLLPREYDDD